MNKGLKFLNGQSAGSFNQVNLDTEDNQDPQNDNEDPMNLSDSD